MNPKQLAAKTRLEALKGEILSRRILPKVERISETQEHSRMLQDNEEQAQELNRAQGRLRMIEDALGRIREGSWGVCGDCSSIIPTKRLEALPWAAKCAPCQSVQEKLEQ